MSSSVAFFLSSPSEATPALIDTLIVQSDVARANASGSVGLIPGMEGRLAFNLSIDSLSDVKRFVGRNGLRSHATPLEIQSQPDLSPERSGLCRHSLLEDAKKRCQLHVPAKSLHTLACR